MDTNSQPEEAIQGFSESAHVACQVVFLVSVMMIYLYTMCQWHLMWCDFRKLTFTINWDKQDIRQVKSIESGSDRYKFIKPEDFPFVTIQLPIYNELYVVNRLIDNVVKMDWPKERFEVQVLDDSTDETVDLTLRKVNEWKQKGYNIEQLRRSDRSGYKAGALKEHMGRSRGDYIAYFDADFMPHPDFLRKTIFYFDDPKICLVQARWEFLNADFSILTRLQVLPLNVHFRLEQPGRYNGNFLSQFNGTAGVWRKDSISDSGGWESDTLTEDIDLSIRAQVRGWSIKYVEDVGVPQEIPPHIAALKIQQHRWQKGTAQCARKILPTVWLASNLTLMQKIHVTLKCIEGMAFIGTILMNIVSVPIMVYKASSNRDTRGILDLAPYGLTMLQLVTLFYANVIKHKGERQGNFISRVVNFFSTLPFYWALIQASSVRNALSVLEGWSSKESTFVRTPKFNVSDNTALVQQKKYVAKSLDYCSYVEIFLFFYFLFGVAYAFWDGTYDLVAQHALLVFGFGMMVYYTYLHG